MVAVSEAAGRGRRRVARNATLSMLSSIVMVAAALAASVIAARYLGAMAFGLYSLVQWTRVTAAMVLDIGLATAVTKYVSEFEGSGERSQASRLTLNLLVTQVAIALPAGLLLALFSSAFADFLGREEVAAYLPVAAISLVLGMTNNILMARLAGLQRFDVAALLSLATACLTLVGVGAVIFAALGIFGLLWVEIMVACLQLVVLCTFLIRSGSFRPTTRVTRLKVGELAKFCLGVFVITSFDVIVWQRSETYFLGRYRSPEEIGFYGMAFNFSTILLGTLPAAFGRVLLPALSERFGTGDHNSLQNLYGAATRYIAAVTFPLCAGGIAVSSLLMAVLFPPEFSPAADVMKILLVGGAIGAIAGPGSALLIALGKTMIPAYWGLPLALANVLLAFWLVPPLGALGAAVASTITQVAGVLVGTSYLIFVQHFRFPVAPLSRMIVAAVPVGVIAFLISSFWQGIFGLVVAGLMGVLVYVPALIATRALVPADFDLLEDLTGVFPGGFRRILRLAIAHVKRIAFRAV